MEKLDPASGTRYLAPDGYRKFEVREETIRVKGKGDVKITVRESRHGPVISDVVASAAKAAPGGHVLAFSWTALRADDLTSQGAGKLARARNWGEFLSAARDYHSPQQNMVYADVDGNIGFIAPGRIPIRKRENMLQGMAPAPGWDARYDWQGFIPYEQLPQSYNSASGVIVTANQKVVAKDYPISLPTNGRRPTGRIALKILSVRVPGTLPKAFAAFRAT
jgi:penicillin G amidase